MAFRITEDNFNDRIEKINDSDKLPEYVKIKYIQINDNNWAFDPKNNIILKEEKFNEYINEKKLIENMKKIYQSYINWNDYTCEIIMNYEEDNQGDIFYIYTDKKYYWAYIISKIQKGKKIIINLQIHLSSSIISDINKNYLKGNWYIERGQLFRKNINNIHPDICNGIENSTWNTNLTEIRINKNIDIFLNQKTRTINSRYMRDKGQSDRIVATFETTTYGTAYLSDSTRTFVAYDSTINANSSIRQQSLPSATINQWLDTYAEPNTNFNTLHWYFANLIDWQGFWTQLKEYGHNNTQLNDIVEIANSENYNTSWISVPRIFEIGINTLEYFTFDLKDIINFDLKNHLDLHKSYFIIIGRTFKIPIDPLKLKNKKIYGKRIVTINNVIFTFSYDQDKYENFYEIRLATANGLNSDSWREYQHNLELEYQSGSIGIGSQLNKLFERILVSLPSFLGGAGLGITNIVGSVITSGFNLFSESKQQKYAMQQILSKGNESKNTLLSEALNDLIFDSTNQVSFANLHAKNLFGVPDEINTYIMINKNTLGEPISSFMKIMTEEPIADDMLKIEYDQKLFGNLLNLRKNIDNPLILTENDYNYFKGIVLNFDNNKNTILFQQQINKEFNKGIVILNNADKWE